MKHRFLTLWEQLGAQDDPVPIFTDLEKRYSEPHRRYHTLDHITQCLSEFDAVRHFLSEPLAVEMAIWYHDAVYDTHRKDNEEQSARLAWKVCAAAGLRQRYSDRVADLVNMTAKHQATDADAQLFMDIDLSILGKPPMEFEAYDAAIRFEYAWVPECQFMEIRGGILRGFIERSTIYATPFFEQRYGAQAKRNLTRALERVYSSA